MGAPTFLLYLVTLHFEVFECPDQRNLGEHSDEHRPPFGRHSVDRGTAVRCSTAVTVNRHVAREIEQSSIDPWDIGSNDDTSNPRLTRYSDSVRGSVGRTRSWQLFMQPLLSVSDVPKDLNRHRGLVGVGREYLTKTHEWAA